MSCFREHFQWTVNNRRVGLSLKINDVSASDRLSCSIRNQFHSWTRALLQIGRQIIRPPSTVRKLYKCPNGVCAKTLSNVGQ